MSFPKSRCPYAIIAILALACAGKLANATDGVQPCSFNPMCACKSNLQIISGQLSNTPVRKNDQGGIICVNVPFSSVPRFPAGSVSHIDLVNSGLEYLEGTSLFHPNVKSLRLTSNAIKLIENDTFHFVGESLRSLDLSQNALSIVPVDALATLKKVEWINLDQNFIAVIDGHAFEGLESLGTLFLAKNQIVRMDPEAFANMQNLRWLNLDSNGIDDADLLPGAFPKSLNTLFLASNHLQVFPTEVMLNLKNVTWLYLRGNHIRYLPSVTPLPQSINFDKLDISENFLPEIPPNGTIFGGSVTAHDLYLEHNWFSEVPRSAFKNMQVKRLSLAHNRIEKIDDDAFLGVHDTLMSLDLEDNKLEAVPYELARLSNLTLLYLPRNKIEKIDAGVLQNACRHLEVLDLNRNNLTIVPGDELRRCHGLTSLGLSHNRIKNVAPDDFAIYGRNMEILDLRSNGIEHLKGRCFQHTPFLKELYLSHNPLTNVAPDAFSDLSNSLEKLTLSGSLTAMRSFPQDQLSYIRSVQWLALDDNDMQVLPDAALLFFTKLRFLNLEHNVLKAIPRTIFHSNVHSSLADVRLTGNRIESLERENFANLDMLQTVVLTGNRLKMIHTKAFYKLPNLVAISADRNKIRTIEKEAFFHLPALAKLDLQQNNLEDFSLASLTSVSQETTLLALNLSLNHLSSISSRSIEPLYVKTVDLSFNYLQELPSNLLQAAGPYLRELHLRNNKLVTLGNSAFRYQENLQVLDVSNNGIKHLHPTCLQSLSGLQILDLSDNQISALPPGLFSNMLKLRVLKVSGNRISHLPSAIFRDTFLERLDLSRNKLQTVPTQSLEPVNMTLRNVDLSENSIQYFEHSTFESTRNILSLNIGGNQFRDLPYDLFEPMERLLTLGISNNDIYSSSVSRALQPLRHLRVLSLENCRLTEYISTNLTSLTHLYLSGNDLSGRSLRKENLRRTPNLRLLDLSYNKIEEIPTGAWEALPHLASLNLSGNLMSALTKERFHGLHTLRQLALVDLEHVVRFDSDSLSRLLRLEDAWLETYPWIEKYRFRLGSILGYLTNLRTAHVKIRQTDLTDQLHGAALPKLKELDITGSNLRRVDGSAFRDVFGSSALTLRLHHTSVQKIPDNFIAQVDHIPYLRLDFSSNNLTSFSPEAIYKNASEWESVGTGRVSGGIQLAGNPLECSCELVWAGKWLRRWLQESRDIHSEILETAAEVQGEVGSATCYHPLTEENIPLLELHEIDLNCSQVQHPTHAAKVRVVQGANMNSSAQRCLSVPRGITLLQLFTVSCTYFFCVSLNYLGNKPRSEA